MLGNGDQIRGRGLCPQGAHSLMEESHVGSLIALAIYLLVTMKIYFNPSKS